MKGLKDFYLERKKSLLRIVHFPDKDDNESQENLDRYLKTSRLKKFKEAEYFREEFMEPQTDEARLQA